MDEKAPDAVQVVPAAVAALAQKIAQAQAEIDGGRFPPGAQMTRWSTPATQDANAFPKWRGPGGLAVSAEDGRVICSQGRLDPVVAREYASALLAAAQAAEQQAAGDTDGSH